MNGIIKHVKIVAEDTLEIAIQASDLSLLNFIPGQFVEVFLSNLGDGIDARGKGREFSIASVPNDSSLTLLTRRGESPYKKYLLDCNYGEKVYIAGPFGNFIPSKKELPDQYTFVASGVGVAPFLSIIRTAKRDGGFLRPTTLLWKTQTRARAPYIEELEEIERLFPDFKIITVPGEKLPTTLVSLVPRNEYEEIHGRLPMTIHYYMAGGQKPIREAYQTLRANDVAPEHIFTEEFSGY
ncbi:MAG: hypothetical protein COV07_00060 [Candidatus Vogelbacteria bacterium CG10_big_fil_rev_8_21_14_0_10_45_14]|uniref:FAD-binding FR-type domain-containing protein n=1 Tax=Candidatus Vogelbacteria bacterium CG10_big_fil_rev_8_21_14_0_10_45_14 TaxID=1975042 RepID=A0A2H0RLB2_9BACT|nr:MAG: hypothetical protein COV07_00060 [Candidatus Vogelbacteria bacterium CG10_big_fil_rev_8_21_14_0_10_45_14]